MHVDPIEPANLEMNGLVPQKWHEVFGRVLAKKPDDRYQTATEFVQDLEYCLGSWFTGIADDAAIAADGDATRRSRADAASVTVSRRASRPLPPGPSDPPGGG